MNHVEVPDHAGSRPQAQRLVEDLPADLSRKTIILDCSRVLVATPSFLDEIVKQVLLVRGADALEVRSAPSRASDLLERAAQNRGVADRLRLTTEHGTARK